MKNNRSDRYAIERIIVYCDDISTLCEKHNNSREAFDNDIEFEYACSLCIIQIGELVSRISDAFKDRYENVPWKEIKGMRNIFVHDYGMVSNDILWETLQEDIPALRKMMEETLSAEQDKE